VSTCVPSTRNVRFAPPKPDVGAEQRMAGILWRLANPSARKAATRARVLTDPQKIGLSLLYVNKSLVVDRIDLNQSDTEKSDQYVHTFMRLR
jgi:hypothetical protein